MLEHLKAIIKNERRWSRKIINILAYHTLKCSQYEDKRNIKWTIKDSARELEMSVGSISEALNLARALPKIENFEFLTREEALKKMRELK